VERETFPALVSSGAVVIGYVDNAYWLDVGTPEAFVRGSCDLVLGRMPSAALPGPYGPALVLPGAEVDPGAQVCGGTVVGPGSAIAAGAAADGSVLLDGVTVEAGAQVRASLLGRGARVGAGAVLDGAFIGDGAVIASGNELRRGVRVWPHVELGPTAVRFSTDA
jgi:mannose-1-phosphate guanylyltransferase